jgi:hypothetical protein
MFLPLYGHQIVLILKIDLTRSTSQPHVRIGREVAGMTTLGLSLEGVKTT